MCVNNIVVLSQYDSMIICFFVVIIGLTYTCNSKRFFKCVLVKSIRISKVMGLILEIRCKECSARPLLDLC